MKKIVHAVGARPNFIKLAPVVDALAANQQLFQQVIVHTGQHYDQKLSSDVLADVKLPTPDRFLDVGSGLHGEQTGRIMIAFERVLLEESPDLVIVAGDVNSTLACALVAAKLGIPIAHVEAGLRSGDWSMPEEINRVLTDRVADFLFTHSPEAESNLIREGINPSRVHYVGNTMIDSLRRFEATARARAAWRDFDLNEGEYVLATLHRLSNVDDEKRRAPIVEALVSLIRPDRLSRPSAHARATGRLRPAGPVFPDSGALYRSRWIYRLPLARDRRPSDSYRLRRDSGGGFSAWRPCFTFRANTERPVTLTIGTNTLSGEDPAVQPKFSTGQPLACVCGGGIDLVRTIGLAGIRSCVVAEPGNPTRYSRFADAVIDWIDPRCFPDELIRRLVGFSVTQAEPPVLYYDGDWELLFISRFRSRLSEAFRFVVPDATLVEDLVDKARFQALAERLDLPVPPARAVVPAETRLADVELPHFPVIVKPLTRSHESWSRISTSKALEVPSREGLAAIWPHLVEMNMEVVLQDAVPGPERLVESYHVYVDGAGELVAEFTGRKMRTYPEKYGYSSALVITDQTDVRRLGREVCGRLKLRGVAKFDFKRGDGGKLYLLEVNPRFTLWHHPAAKAGVNIPAIVFGDLVGLRREASIPYRARAGVEWCSFRHDIRAARNDGISFFEWLRWFRRVEAKSMIAGDDLMPFVRGTLWRLGHATRSRLRRAGGDSQPFGAA